MYNVRVNNFYSFFFIIGISLKIYFLKRHRFNNNCINSFCSLRYNKKLRKCAMAAVRKRKRITPTLLTAPAGPDPSVIGAPLADVPTAVAVKFSTSQELEVVSKAVKQLQPLKIGRAHV